jgi:hypothetical protein
MYQSDNVAMIMIATTGKLTGFSYDRCLCGTSAASAKPAPSLKCDRMMEDCNRSTERHLPSTPPHQTSPLFLLGSFQPHTPPPPLNPPRNQQTIVPTQPSQKPNRIILESQTPRRSNKHNHPPLPPLFFHPSPLFLPNPPIILIPSRLSLLPLNPGPQIRRIAHTLSNFRQFHSCSKNHNA